MATKNTCFWMKSGLSMCTYCKLQGYDYNIVYHLADKFGLEPEEAIKRYLERRGKKDENNLKHTFRGVSLRKITTRQQYGRIMEYKHKHHIKYEESIIGQIMSKEEYEQIYLKCLNLKIASDKRLTPQETKDYIALSEPKGMTEKEYYEMKLKEV